MLDTALEAALVANYLAVGAWVLVALLLGANIMLRIGTPALTSDRHELSERQHPSPTQTIVTAPAPALDMASEAELPTPLTTQSAPEVLGTIEPTPRAARAEAQPTKKRVTRKQPPIKQPQLYGDSFSNKDY